MATTTNLAITKLEAAQSQKEASVNDALDILDAAWLKSWKWVKVTKTYAQLAAAATTNDIEILSLAAKGIIHAVVIAHSASFTGGAISAYTLSVGIAGNLTKYAAAFNVFQATGNTVFQFSTTQGLENMGAATSIRGAATATGANLNAATAGSVDIWIAYSVLP